MYAYVPNFVSIGLFYRPQSGGEKPQFLPFFGLRHLVVSPVGGSMRKLNTGAQLRTFPYPTASKSFLYSNAFMAKSGAQTQMFKSVTDRQTGKTRWLYCVECPQYSTRLEALGCLCDCVSGRVQR